MTVNQDGYPLPVGDLGGDDIVCQLVYLPDRDAYWQALLAAIHFMTTWLAWEKDDDHRAKDAADNWKVAFELTMECWRMACLDDLKSDVNAIKLLLLLRDSCCSTSTSYDITTIITTTISPGVGGDPSEYGETEVVDWEEWLEHLCFQAHQYVDRLLSYGRVIDSLFVSGGLTLDAWSNILNVLQFSGLPIPFYIVDAVEWLSAFFLDVSDVWFDDVTDEIEASRDAIVCAIMQDGDLSAVIEGAITSSLAWTLFYNLIDYDQVKAVLYEGGYDDEFLPTETRDDCDCPIPEGYSWQPATEITFTQAPDTFGRVNVVSVDLPEISIGRKVATSASWACPGYANGADAFNARHETYETLAMRITCVSINGAGSRYWDSNCNVYSVDESRALYYTYDVAEGIDEDWANGQSTYHRKIAGGHAKRAADYEWVTGALANHDTTPGADPIESVWRVDFLIWVP